MKNQTSKFREKDVVRVLPGVKDPDFGANIGGWSGTIEGMSLSESGSWLYAIRWDQGTLSIAGDDYVDRCENENLDFEIMYLEEKLLELVENLGDTEHGFFLA